MENKSYIEREVVGYFHDTEALQAAIDKLSAIGVDKTEISCMTSAEDVERRLGDQFGIETINTVDGVPEIVYKNEENASAGSYFNPGTFMYVGELLETAPVILTGGTLAAGLMAGLVSGGKTIKKALEKMVGLQHAKRIEHELKGGGVLLWVRVWNESDEHRVSLILEQNSGRDVHVHRFTQETEHEPVAADNGIELSYHGVPYLEAGENEYYVSGKLFASEEEAKEYIRRHSYVERLYRDAKVAKLDLEEVLRDLIQAFETPANLMEAPLAEDLKVELLKRWAYYEQELEVAADDGMVTPDNPGAKLQEIDNYIRMLTGE